MPTLVLLIGLSSASTIFAIITMTANQTYVPVGNDVHISCRSDVKKTPILIFNGTTEMSSCSVLTCQLLDPESSSTIPVIDKSNPGYDIVSFEVRNFQITDSGIYACKKKDNQTVQDSLTVNYAVVIASVKLTPDVDLVNVIDGVPFTFTCVTSDSRPAASVFWFKGSENITALSKSVTTNYVTTSTLTYTPNRDDQGKIIRCDAKNGGTTVTSSTSPQANIQYGPSVPNCDYDGADAPSAITVREGASFSLDCTSSGNPPPNLTWTHPGPGPTSPLTLTNIQKSHNGTFIVSSNNTLRPSGQTEVPKSNSTSYAVLVMYKAVITDFKVASSDGEKGIIKEGSTVAFVCGVDSYPGAQIVLQKAGQPIKEVSNSQSILYVKNSSQCEDEGTYICTGSNVLNIEPDKKTLQVFVRCSPRVSSQSSPMLNVTAGIGKLATLTFNFIAYPRPSTSDVIWEKHHLKTDDWTVLYNTSDIAVKLSENGLQTNITVIDVKQSDFGQYRVNVSNELGYITEYFLLKAEEVPGSPGNLQTSDGVTESSVAITWTPGFDGGLAQTFIVMFRDTSTVKWKEDNVKAGHIEHTLHNLKPGTTYEVKVIARNSLGNSSESDSITITTLKSKESPPPGQAAIIGGVVGGVAGIGLLVTVLFVVSKLRQKAKTKEDASNLKSKMHSMSRSTKDDEDDEVINPIYAGGADDQNLPADIIYSKPIKLVNEQKKHKRSRTKGEDVKSDPDMYGNHDVSTAKHQPRRTTNQDGLVYADLEFPDQSKSQKPIIHGMDDMTEYAELDRTKKADPLPESDDEGEGIH